MSNDPLRQISFAPVSRAATKSTAPRRFRYSYLYRLIDDVELQDLAPSVRSELRRVHKEAYWKNLALLRRDASRVLRLRRERMGAAEAWDFTALVNDYARMQYLLATLTMAGVSHSTRISLGLGRVRAVCSEFEAMFTSAPLAAATA